LPLTRVVMLSALSVMLPLVTLPAETQFSVAEVR
jgi:hypothetical protein